MQQFTNIDDPLLDPVLGREVDDDELMEQLSMVENTSVTADVTSVAISSIITISSSAEIPDT